MELDQEDRLITADVKDFFVVGDHWYLARMAASILEPKERNLIERVILFLLRNQFVTCTQSVGIFQVEQGFGFSGSDGETVYPETGSDTREAHQSLFQTQGRHLHDRQRWQRQPRHACETLETRCNLAQVPVFDRRLGCVK